MLASGARALSVAVSVVACAIAVLIFSAVHASTSAHGLVGYDFSFYASSARRWLETGVLYEPIQLAGPYSAAGGDVFLYPPNALFLFVPFATLPGVLWWIVPIGILVVHFAYWRPAWWSWPILAAIAALLPTSSILVVGNSDLWVAAVLAVACRWPAIAVLTFLKPPAALFGLLFMADRRWWVALGVLGVASIGFGGLWVDWLIAVGNAEGSLFRNVNSYPFLVVPLLVRVASTREAVRLPRITWLARRVAVEAT